MKHQNNELAKAIADNELDVAAALIQSDADFSGPYGPKKRPLLHEALSSFKNMDPVINAILDQDFDVNATDSDGYTALHLAVIFSKTDAVKKLLLKNADPNAKKDFWTPLSLAVRHHKEAIPLLIEHGASVRDKSIPTFGGEKYTFMEATDYREELMEYKAVAKAYRYTYVPPYCTNDNVTINKLADYLLIYHCSDDETGAPIIFLVNRDGNTIIPKHAKLLSENLNARGVHCELSETAIRFPGFTSSYEDLRRHYDVIKEACLEDPPPLYQQPSHSNNNNNNHVAQPPTQRITPPPAKANAVTEAIKSDDLALTGANSNQSLGFSSQGSQFLGNSAAERDAAPTYPSYATHDDNETPHEIPDEMDIENPVAKVLAAPGYRFT